MAEEQQMPREILEEVSARLDSYAEAMNAGRPEDAMQLALEIFRLAAEDSVNPDELRRGQFAAINAEMRGEWRIAEQIYHDMLLGDDSERRRGHFGLAVLYEFLSRPEESLAHGRAAYALCRDYDVGSVRVLAATVFARLEVAKSVVDEAEQALRVSLASLGDEALLNHTRANASIEMANLWRLKGSGAEAEILLDAAANWLQADSPMHCLPGYQKSIGRLWNVRAMLQADRGDLLHSGDAWKAAHQWLRAAIGRIEEETAIDMQRYRRFLEEAAAGLRAAEDHLAAEEVAAECEQLVRDWLLPPGW